MAPHLSGSLRKLGLVQQRSETKMATPPMREVGPLLPDGIGGE